MIKNIKDLAPYLADEDKARTLFEKLRWPSGPICPHCGNHGNIYRLEGRKHRKGLLKCSQCRQQFTVTVGTVFEDSRVPLGKWLYAIFMMCNSKKGVSAKQLERALGVSYKTSWFMCHRVRLAMQQPPLVGALGGNAGIVEVDETYIGGKASNNRRRPPLKKPIVAAVIDRQGDARTFLIPNTKARTLKPLVRLVADETAHIMTDEHYSYKGLDRYFLSHDSVNHSAGEYVRGIIHTSFADSYFSLLKRGIFGTFHHVSERHLPRYLREFEFRWNSRKATDGERTVAAIKGASGKRLMYRQPINP